MLLNKSFCFSVDEDYVVYLRPFDEFMVLRKVIIIVCLLWIGICPFFLAGNVKYTKADSLKVVSLLNEAKSLPVNESRILFFAKSLLDTPYKDRTLEEIGLERLVVNMKEVDCTTFVEIVLALSVVDKRDKSKFSDFITALQEIRYRDGIIDGYCSRLHYFSDWIRDNEKKGLIKDISERLSSDTQILHIHFMSANSGRYLHLRNNVDNQQMIRKQEDCLNGEKIYYLSKKRMENSDVLKGIKDGDLIALVTNISGLDISHVGLAVWKEGELYLLNASSLQIKVEIDAIPLVKYVSSKKTLMGIRVLSLLP